MGELQHHVGCDNQSYPLNLAINAVYGVWVFGGENDEWGLGMEMLRKRYIMVAY